MSYTTKFRLTAFSTPQDKWQSHEDFYRTAELYTPDTIEPCFQHVQELDLVNSYNTYDNAERKENFLVR